MILLTHRVVEQRINDAITALEALQAWSAGGTDPRRTPELTDLCQGPTFGGLCSRMI
jgi:hypothetical protein